GGGGTGAKRGGDGRGGGGGRYGRGGPLGGGGAAGDRAAGGPAGGHLAPPGSGLRPVAGFLVGEGVLTGPEQLATIRYCAGASGDDRTNTYNVLDVTQAELGPRQNFYTSSSCGVCGKTSLDAVRTRAAFQPTADPPEGPAGA